MRHRDPRRCWCFCAACSPTLMADLGMALRPWLDRTPIEPRRWTMDRAPLRLSSPRDLPSTPTATPRMPGGRFSGCGRKTREASGIAHIRCGNFRRVLARQSRHWTTRPSPSGSAEPSRGPDLASTSSRSQVITHHSLAGLANSLIFSIDLPGTERADAATKHKLVVLAAKACCTLPYDRLSARVPTWSLLR